MLEVSFSSQAAPAALKMARYYDKAKMESERNATLFRILKKYKGTKEHSNAHRWAENLGLRFTTSNIED